ncbi:hypothetical protein SCLCIDRAFT_658312 [Scleroderma citrinum Foug A]|uniref:Uncharacterized protein n=1 Tax=Scleroderma citrinum Foug A TaxID=1036808 RepID=A0A0C2ZRH8_9AGAM|nr:hypothetical protein SCLCIDRAFT_658312 [Scleroderma citrinum Foug A]
MLPMMRMNDERWRKTSLGRSYWHVGMVSVLKSGKYQRRRWIVFLRMRQLIARYSGLELKDWRTLAAFSEMRSPNHQMMLKLIYDAFWRMQMQEYPSTSYSLLNGLHENSKGDIRLPAADWKLTLRKLP